MTEDRCGFCNKALPSQAGKTRGRRREYCAPSCRKGAFDRRQASKRAAASAEILQLKRRSKEVLRAVGLLDELGAGTLSRTSYVQGREALTELAGFISFLDHERARARRLGDMQIVFAWADIDHELANLRKAEHALGGLVSELRAALLAASRGRSEIKTSRRRISA